MVVIGIIALLAMLAIPSLSALTEGASTTGARNMLRGLFASVKTRALSHNEYAAVRFQQGRDGQTYAIILETPKPDDGYKNFRYGCPADAGGFPESGFIPDDPGCGYIALVAADGVEPIALPRGAELAAGDINNNNTDPTGGVGDNDLTDPNWANATSFTIVFAPTGQVVRRDVFVGQRFYTVNRNLPYPDNFRRQDTVFFDDRIRNIQDAFELGLDISERDWAKVPRLQPDPFDRSTREAFPELSQTSLWVYDREKRMNAAEFPFSGYVGRTGRPIQLNVYTGELID